MEKFQEAVAFACRYFEIEKFHEEQIECIRQFFSGKNIFCSAPTGFGKSLIYQSLPLIHDFVVYESCPLESLPTRQSWLFRH